MMISKTTRALPVFLCFIFVIIFLSCGTDTSSKNDAHGTFRADGNGLAMSFSSPGDLASAVIGFYDLQAEATVNGGSPYPLNVNQETNEISGTIPDISPGTYTLQVTYFVFTSEKVILCTFTKDVTVTASQQSNVIIGDADLNRNYDNDNDSFTNLEEIREKTDPLDSDSHPVILPDPPSNVTAIPGIEKVTLSWDSVTDESTYNIYLGIFSGVSKNSYDASYICDVTSCYIDGLTSGVVYYFVVTSVTGIGESNESAEVNATPYAFEPDCVDADGDTFGTGADCLGPQDCDDSNKLINPDSTEICDNIDNNCDGQKDENLLKLITCGVGECKNNTGTETCSNGIWVNNTCDPFAGAVNEICDGLDNDCDGTIDNGVCAQPGDSCGATLIYDCNQNCAPATWLGDGICDSDPTEADFTCINNDNGDCINPGVSCDTDKIYDCLLNCEPVDWLGDGICDNDTLDIDPDAADFVCINNDEGDCL
ncbi:MAG: hypothetical protein JSW20_05165 [Nitrospiraceae bacterium]|nr:MAG: hypothetical protein JSW20_05165 [Nitrospiraceae bacterium]